MIAQSVNSTSWSQEDDDYVRDNYREKSAAKIAEALGRTKNSIIGRARRLGLGKPYGEVFGPGAKDSRKSTEGEGVDNSREPNILNRKPAARRVVKVSAPEIIPLNGVGVKIWDLEPRHCRWVIGEPKDLTFCGHDHSAGSAYCDGHKGLTLQKV